MHACIRYYHSFFKVQSVTGGFFSFPGVILSESVSSASLSMDQSSSRDASGMSLSRPPHITEDHTGQNGKYAWPPVFPYFGTILFIRLDPEI